MGGMGIEKSGRDRIKRNVSNQLSSLDPATTGLQLTKSRPATPLGLVDAGPGWSSQRLDQDDHCATAVRDPDSSADQSMKKHHEWTVRLVE